MPPLSSTSNCFRGRLRALWLSAFAVAVAMGAQAAETTVPDTLEQRIAACTGCHGEHGEGGANGFNPRLAGKPALYLYRQLLNFREGRRSYPVMEYMLRPLPDAYLEEMAAYFAAQETAYPPRHPPRLAPALVQRGQTLAMHGDVALDVPACAACHGDRLTGVAPATPGLVGLPYDYLSAQLGAWRTQTRGAPAPDCMATIAHRLRPADISAVSAWLAALEVPVDPRPLPAGSVTPPMRCGSLENLP